VKATPAPAKNPTTGNVAGTTSNKNATTRSGSLH
jgi:hypothetical protein